MSEISSNDKIVTEDKLKDYLADFYNAIFPFLGMTSEDIIDGYYNETDNKFYEESTYETEITPEIRKIYISLDTDKSYYWDGSEYKLLSGGGGVSDFDDLTNRPQESDAIDIDDLDLPMPAKPTDYPILFDETGAEYKVGLYKRASDGKVKPVWRKECRATSSINIPSNTWTPIASMSSNLPNNVEKMISAFFYNQYDAIPIDGEWYDTAISVRAHIPIVLSSDYTYVYFVLEYTKTTDSWKEV